MRLRIADPAGLDASDIAAWSHLADHAAEPNPNADPRFVLAALGRGLGAEDLRLAIVVDDDGGFALVLPFTRAERIAGIPARHLTTHGAFMHEFASKNHPLVSTRDPAGALRTLLTGLRSHGLPDLVELTVLPVDSLITEALAVLEAAGAARSVERLRDTRAYARRADLSPPGTAAEAPWYSRSGDVLSFPVPHLSARTRRSLGQYGRQIERAAGGPLTVSRHDDDPAVVEEFLELQASGWKGDESLTGPQFRRRGHEEWFRDVAGRFRDDGRLRVLRLSAGGETVYLAVFVVSGGRPFGFHDVFAERFRRSSPGFVGRLAQLGHVLEEPGAAPFDPGMEAWYSQANTAFPSRREHANILVAGPSQRSRAVVRLLPVARRVRERLRAVATARGDESPVVPGD